jgi:Flp pilus assembly protein TadD
MFESATDTFIDIATGTGPELVLNPVAAPARLLTEVVPRNGPCPCGSGLKHRNCCGNLKLRLPDRLEVLRLDDEYQTAVSAFNNGDLDVAEATCIALLDRAPGHLRGLSLLYHIRKGQGHKQSAEVLVKRIVSLNPEDTWALAELSLLLYERRDLSAAEHWARELIRRDPDHAQGHNLLGMILTDSYRYQAGEFHYRRALALHGAVGKLCANLGLNLKLQGKLEEAERCYRQAAELEPDNSDTLMGWVRLAEVQRDTGQAWALLERVRQFRSEDDPSVCLTRSVLHRRSGAYAEALSSLDNIPAARRDGNAGYHYERGMVLDKLAHYDQAFEHFAEANRLVCEVAGRGYAEADAAQLAVRLKAYFIRERISRLPRGEASSEEAATPIFIVGFPRSGTTLVEQMLSMHGQISAGDELPLIHQMTEEIPRLLGSRAAYPQALSDLWFGENQSALAEMRARYLKGAAERGAIERGARFFTDKMPLNETHLGLIAMLFPEAPIIHLIRHPLDVVLSCFFNDLSHGYNCSYALQSAARHFVLVRDLVDHYLEHCQANYLAVRYEDLIAEPETYCRRLLEFITVDWDQRCLAFERNPRYARTASYAQVTQRLYGDSVYRHRHYLSHLGDLVDTLQPFVERLGYQIQPGY